jgi:hypothetical protein
MVEYIVMLYSYNIGVVAIIAEPIGLLELQLEIYIINLIPLMPQHAFRVLQYILPF